MNCWNSSKYLKEAIDSVFAQTYQDWEIILFDDASTDNSVEICKQYDQNKLKLFVSDIQYPLGKARNLAIEKASGEYIAFLDCDDMWLPEKLAKQVPLFDNPKVGIVASNAYLFDKNGNNFPSPEYLKHIPPQGLVFRHLLRDYFLCLQTVIIRKTALVELGEWFDNRFNQIEEMDVFLRIAKTWEVAYVPEVLAKYRIHKDSYTYTHLSSSPKEKELLIEKYTALYPGFEKEYEAEIRLIRNQIGYERFSIAWLDNKPKEARSYLKPYLQLNQKLIPYIFSYLLPASTFYSLVRVAIKLRLTKKVAEFK